MIVRALAWRSRPCGPRWGGPPLGGQQPRRAAGGRPGREPQHQRSTHGRNRRSLGARDFGLAKDELRYVLDPNNLSGKGSGIETFKALNQCEKRQLGEYRTQRLVLEAWDGFAADGTFVASAAQWRDACRLRDASEKCIVFLANRHSDP